MAAWYFCVPVIIWVLLVLICSFIRRRKKERRQRELNQANQTHQNSQVFVVQSGNPLLVAVLKIFVLNLDFLFIETSS